MISLDKISSPRSIAIGVIAIGIVLVTAQQFAVRSQTQIGLNSDQRTEEGALRANEIHGASAADPYSASAWPRSDVLWTIPLASLTATVERPIFNPARRLPAVVTTGTVPSQPIRPPPLTLVGAIAGENDSVAIFQNKLTKQLVRLKIGESYAGWVLRSVVGREATLQNGHETVTAAVLPQPAK
jgi:hypothetical protein